MKVEVKDARIRLQGVGMHAAVPVEDLRPGMVTVWNWGWAHEVAEVVPSPSGKTFRLTYADGSMDPRRFRRGRLIAVEGAGEVA